MKNRKMILFFTAAAVILLTAVPVLAASGADADHLFGLDGKSRGAIMLIVAMLLLAGSLHFKKK
jgi:hypothetical protein